jgi:hypothetical protein
MSWSKARLVFARLAMARFTVLGVFPFLVAMAALTPVRAIAQGSTGSGALDHLRVAFLSGFDETGPKFLDLDTAAFNAAGLFTTSDGSTLNVSLRLNRQNPRLGKRGSRAREAALTDALGRLAKILERVAGARIVVLLEGDDGSGKGRVVHKSASGGWTFLVPDAPRDRSPEGLQKWLSGVYGYAAVVREAKGGTITLKAAPGVVKKQGLSLAGEPWRPLERPLEARPTKLLACEEGNAPSPSCEVLLGGERALAPGTPVWFPSERIRP